MTHATLRISYADRPLYVRVLQSVTPEYAAVTVTCSGRPGWRQGSQHLVPVARLTPRRRGAHKRRHWWSR